MSHNQYTWKSIVENYETYQQWLTVACVTYTERITAIFEKTVLMEVYYSSYLLSKGPKAFQSKMIRAHKINILYHTYFYTTEFQEIPD
jgi:hypothetical protein